MTRFLYLGIFIFHFFATTLQAQVFKANPELSQIETSYFTIIYSPASRDSAFYIAAIADQLYLDICNSLKLKPSLHLPVVFSSDRQDLNGYFSNYPSGRIVCYQAPLSPNSGFAVFKDTLKKLFTHELVHAVSLSQSTAFGQFMVSIFGAYLYPANYFASPLFTEGIAVSYESADGFGRANDSAQAAVIQQAILENRFPNFNDANGMANRYPYGIWYTYGGWFSRYLINVYGQVAYAELWQRFGNAEGLKDFLGSQGAFAATYKISLEAAWENFRQWMQLRVPVQSVTIPYSSEYTHFKALTSYGDKVYWADSRGIWESGDQVQRRLVPSLEAINRMSISHDGNTILISTIASHTGLSELRLREFDIPSQSYTNFELKQQLHEASYDGDTILACQSHEYTSDIVRITRSGDVSVLFKGSAQLVPSSPTKMADGRIFFLLEKAGQSFLAWLDSNGDITLSTTSLRNIRHVSIHLNSIYFIWDNDQTLMKLGILEGEKLSTYPSISGGVQFPVCTDTGIVYVAYFTEGQRLMRLAQQPSAVQEVLSSPLDLINPTMPSQLQAAKQPELQEKPYSALEQAIWPQMWFPMLKFDPAANGFDLFKGIGIVTGASDPAELLGLNLQALWLWNDIYADLTLNIAIKSLPIKLAVVVYDNLLANSSPNIPYDARQIGLELATSNLIRDDLHSLGWHCNLGWAIQGIGSTGSNPYTWDLNKQTIPFNLGLTYRYQELSDFKLDRSFLDIAIDYAGQLKPTNLDWPKGIATLLVKASIPSLGLGLGSTISLAATPSIQLGPLGISMENDESWAQALPYKTLGVYKYDIYNPGVYLWRSWADLGLKLKVEQDFILDIRLNSLEIRGGYEGTLVAEQWLDTVYAQLGLDFRLGTVPSLQNQGLSAIIRIDFALRGKSALQWPQLQISFGQIL